MSLRRFDKVLLLKSETTGVIDSTDQGSLTVITDEWGPIECYPNEVKKIDPFLELHYQRGIPWLLADVIKNEGGVRFLSQGWSLNLSEHKIMEFGVDIDKYSYFDYENRQGIHRAHLIVSRDYLASVFSVYYRLRDNAKQNNTTGKTVIDMHLPANPDTQQNSQ